MRLQTDTLRVLLAVRDTDARPGAVRQGDLVTAKRLCRSAKLLEASIDGISWGHTNPGHFRSRRYRLTPLGCKVAAAQGSLVTKKVATPKPADIDTTVVVDGGAARHKSYRDVKAAIKARCNVYLVGPAGCGKTTLCRQIAEDAGLPFYMSGAVMQKYELEGFIDAAGNYKPTLLHKAYSEGGVFLLDEIDGCGANALLAANAILANDVANFPCGMVKRHPDFIAIAAANTFGQGRDSKYVGRARLDAATLDRFVQIRMGYDESLEAAVCGNEAWLRVVRAARKAVEESTIDAIVSPRAAINGARLLAQGVSVDKAVDWTILRGLPDDARMKIKRRIKEGVA